MIAIWGGNLSPGPSPVRGGEVALTLAQVTGTLGRNKNRPPLRFGEGLGERRAMTVFDNCPCP